MNGHTQRVQNHHMRKSPHAKSQILAEILKEIRTVLIFDILHLPFSLRGFPHMVILDTSGMPIHTAKVPGQGKDFLIKSILTGCD